LPQVGDLFQLNVKLRCQKVNFAHHKIDLPFVEGITCEFIPRFDRSETKQPSRDYLY